MGKSGIKNKNKEVPYEDILPMLFGMGVKMKRINDSIEWEQKKSVVKLKNRSSKETETKILSRKGGK